MRLPLQTHRAWMLMDGCREKRTKQHEKNYCVRQLRNNLFSITFCESAGLYFSRETRLCGFHECQNTVDWVDWLLFSLPPTARVGSLFYKSKQSGRGPRGPGDLGFGPTGAERRRR